MKPKTYSKQNPTSIQALFDNIAPDYDKTNNFLSFCFHKKWNHSLIKHALPKALSAPLLDLCAGTGEISLSYLKKQKTKQTAYLLDFSSEMLSLAKKKQEHLGLAFHDIHYLQADALHIPLDKESVGCVTIAYGIRNVKDPALCLKEVWRVLKPGGTLGILELTEPSNPLLRLGHKCYLKTFLPLLGSLLTRNQPAYHYLQQSIKEFIQPHKLAEWMQQIGFKDITIKPQTAGIATLILAQK